MSFEFRTALGGGQVSDQDQLTLTNDAGKEIIVTFCTGLDGTPVLFVDTPELGEDAAGPILRINLNDEPVWANPEFSLADDDGTA